MATASKTGVTKYTTPTDREIVVTRVVDAPRRLVFAACTDPKAHPAVAARSGRVDDAGVRDRSAGRRQVAIRLAQVGRRGDGDARHHSRGGAARAAGHTERWGPEWPETVNTIVLTESAGKTTITLTISYPSKAARDAALETGMKGGMDQSFARLDGSLRTLA